MTDKPRRRWVVDIWEKWDEEHDEGIRRMAEAEAAMRERPTIEPVRPRPPEPMPVTQRLPEPPPMPQPTRRERIAALAARVRAGDLSAVAALRELLDG